MSTAAIEQDTTTLPSSFWAKVTFSGSCWLWGSSITSDGYGRVFGFRDRFGTTMPHRIAWMDANGPIPQGMELDHLCSTRNCVNPDHLEPVTHDENIRRAVARRETCRNGHPRTAETWVSDYLGGFRCILCRRVANAASSRRRRARRKASA